jgi:hypothetical protein
MISLLALTSALLVEPQLGRAASPMTFEDDPVLAECSKRLEEMFSLITIQVQELALDQVKVKVVEQQYSVIVPLKTAHGGVKGIQWTQKDPNVAVDFIRCLRHGNIGAVNV